jgi:hypothetical protein
VRGKLFVEVGTSPLFGSSVRLLLMLVLREQISYHIISSLFSF